MRPIPLVPALLLAASAAVAETHDADLRLTIGWAPGVDKVEIKDAKTPAGAPDPAADGTFDMDPKYGFSIEPSIMFRTDWHGVGLVGGPNGFFTIARGERTTGPITDKRKQYMYGLALELGPSFQFDWLRLEVLPIVGVGGAHTKAEVTVAAGNTQYDSGNGWCFLYGLRGGLYADNDEGLVGVQLGWQAFRAQVKFDGAAGRDSDTETITGSGIFAAFVAGVAF